MGPALSLCLRLVNGAAMLHLWSVILKASGACVLGPLTAVFQSCLCFQGVCRDHFLGLVKSKEASLSLLLLGRYSLLEFSSMSFGKHWGLNAIYSQCRRSQMLIFLLTIPEAFVLMEVSAASDNWCFPPLVWLMHLTSQGGGRRHRGHAARLLLVQKHQLSCWNWILKLEMGWRIPVSSWAWNASTVNSKAWFSRLGETLRAAESVLWVICNDFYDSNCIKFSDGEVLWVYLGFLLLVGTFYFYESNTYFFYV